MWRIGGILLLLVVAIRAQEIGCPLVDTPPKVDGKADEEAWKLATPTAIETRDRVHPAYTEKWSGPDDLSAQVRAVRSNVDLFLLVEVRDDVLMHESGRRFWIGDSIEVFLDNDLIGDPGEERYSDDDRQLFLLPFYDGVKWSVVSRGPGMPYPSGGLAGIEVAHTTREGGYLLEARIPLGPLGDVRPDDKGAIGFDVALNDVDTAGAEMTETYMTLSGRQELYTDPTRFARLMIGPLEDETFPETDVTLFPFAPLQMFWGLMGVAVLSLLVRGAARRLSQRGRKSLFVLCGVSVAVAVLLSFVPALVDRADRSNATVRWSAEIDSVTAAARSYLDLDSGSEEHRAERLRLLLERGKVRIRPRYRFHTLPLTPPEKRERVRYGIRLEPGESRTFELDDRPAPATLHARLAVPDQGDRTLEGTVAATMSVGFADQTDLSATAPVAAAIDLPLVLGTRAGAGMTELRVKNEMRFASLVIDAVEAEEPTGERSTVPLTTRTPTGVPFDIWQGRPNGFIVPLRNGDDAIIPVRGVAGHRLWLAGRPIGAYPATPYGQDAVSIKVVYEGEVAGRKLVLRNGLDLKDSSLLFALTGAERLRIAMEWESGGGLPEAYTLHSIVLDPDRPVGRIEIAELGVLAGYNFAAATIGQRAAAAPSADSGLVLEGDRLSVRDPIHEGWSRLDFAVRTRQGRQFGSVSPDRAQARIDTELGTVVIGLPQANWAATLLGRSDVFYAIAALGAAFATVLAGGALLTRARYLRMKMLVALGTATIVPLLFLVIGLSTQLNRSAEAELRTTTEADLLGLSERVLGWRARVWAAAGRLRDTLEPVRTQGGPALASLLDQQRRARYSEGLLLRVPGLDPADGSRFANRNLIDATRGSGLSYSPWDGLMAIGVARAPGRRRYLVAAPAEVMLGGAPTEDVVGIIYAPDGTPLASTKGDPGSLNTPGRRRDVARLADELERGERSTYSADSPLFGQSWASAHQLLREGGRTVGVLGVYRARAPTERVKAGLLRTLLGSGLAALLLVVLAGSMLVEGVTWRLSRVTRAAQSLARGDLESRVPEEAEDEVGDLARSFNAMADALDGRVQQLSDLHHGLQQLATALDRGEAARIGAELIGRATGANHVTVAGFDPATEALETLHRLGDPAPLGDSLPRDGAAQQAIARGSPVRAEGGIFAPLLAADRVVGLAVATPADTDADLDFVDSIARPVGIALENARLFSASVTDELTGLYTEPHIRQRLAEGVDHAAATSRPLSLLRVGVANLPEIRRAHGPRTAARLAAECAETMRRILPARAIGAHRGEGEFVFLLQECAAEEAEARLDQAIDALQRAQPEGLAPRYHRQRVTYPEDGTSSAMLLDRLLQDADAAAAPDGGGELALRVPEHLALVLGESPAMRATLEVVARVAPTTATVLLSGETGAGKEVIADLIQANSDRVQKPYVKVNCAAIPENLVESELFGHEKGAFTGADRQRRGRFETADMGTLFLDEIGDLPLAMQVKLLRVLQERRFTRVGGTEPIAVDVRILAATNRDLALAVRDGSFREDLYHRLHVIELRVPPLRERRDDIARLVEHFRQQFNRSHSLDVAAFRPDAQDALYRYPWPGNVRQLRNVIERSMLMSGGPAVERHHLDLPGAEDEAAPAAAPGTPSGLTPRQERILNRAREQGGITNREIVDSEEVSARTALRELQTLVARGLLTRVGRRRGAVYRPTT
ncbi:MAG: sigma 54-interacting transcriptional regulator [Planctomycetota bacterium]|jgi:DNA-binding NtrC family response regulator/HAMP domain-containing protein